MWCNDCQQDVPAVACSVDGPLVCSRCEAVFEIANEFAQTSAQPVDSGVSLETFDQPVDLSPPLNPVEREQTHQRLRHIGRQLRTAYRFEVADILRPEQKSWGPEALENLGADSQLRSITRQSSREEESSQSTIASRLIGLMLMMGVTGFAVGMGLLVWAVGFDLPGTWQWGITTTIAAEGLLILGMVWMAGRLWRNSRHLNEQLHGVDHQLDHLEQLAGNSATGSQHFYAHFHQGASSQMLLANLRGQVEQLASRLKS